METVKATGRDNVIALCETALLAVLIAISGSFKIPGFVPGTEFQLSAPIAVAICGVFGFKNIFPPVLLHPLFA